MYVAKTCCTSKLREAKNYILSLNVPVLQDFWIWTFLHAELASA